ncbi:membrane protein [Yersinia aldovae]|uniref:winged helix-turn-helix domain-containing protein n=1 Tax=Yersinia aldovae TaxID=29483 RepID=UPI0005E0D105|nr:membrane protein [Yersinia aldovae]CNH98976.1 membrane protein [Yersinia aldovae]
MEINEIVFKLEGTVLFSPAQRCLNGPNGSVAILTENNLRFLQLLLNGVTEKEQIINQVWKEQRGAISESSYYGQLYMLRKAFVQVGLKESLIHTIPRKGVRYTGSVTQVTINQQPEIQQHSKEQKTMEPDTHQVVVASAPFNNTVIPVSKRVVRQSFLQSYRWKKLISLLAFFSFCWLSFLSALIIIILLNGDNP